MLARRFFQLLPTRVRASIYQRLICPRRRDFGHWFEDAPLKFAPAVRMKLSPGDSFHGDIAFCGIYEPEETALIHQIAKEKGGLLVDVGANYGYYTLLWCAAQPWNRVIAIEASPQNARALRENVVRNGFGDRVTIFECAVTREGGDVVFDPGSGGETGWGGIASGLNDGLFTLPGRRLDEMVDEPVTVLKVDCEGADAWVIEGAQGLLDDGRVEHVFFEENRWRQDRLHIVTGAAKELLQNSGFEVTGIGSGPVFSNYHAKKTR